MKLLSIVTTALASSVAASQQVNRTATNGYGSTPAQRHYIDHAQALTAINAGIQRANAIKCVHCGLTDQLANNKQCPHEHRHP